MNTAAYPSTSIMKSRKPESFGNARRCFALTALWLPLALMLAVCPAIYARQCPDSKAHSSLHEKNIRNQLDASLESQNIRPPPSDDPPWSHSDWDDSFKGKLQIQSLLKGLEHEPTLVFIFESEKAQIVEQNNIPVSKADFWCLVRPGDNIILARRISHMTTVFAVDRQNDRLYIVDAWPENFLLPNAEIVSYPEYMQKKGLPVEEKFKDKLLLSIDRETFLRSVQWLQTIDTPSLREHYFEINPNRKNMAGVHLAFGQTFFHGLTINEWIDHRYMSYAVESFEEAVRTADLPREATIQLQAVKSLYVASMIEIYSARRRKNSQELDRYRKILQKTTEQFSGIKFDEILSEFDLFQIGIAAGQARAKTQALNYFNRAIVKNEKFAAAILGRAITHFQMKSYIEAEKDADLVIQLVAARKEVLGQKAEDRDKSDIIGRDLDIGEAVKLRFMDMTARDHRIKALSRILMSPDTQKRSQVIQIAKRIYAWDVDFSLQVFKQMLYYDHDYELRINIVRALAEMKKQPEAVSLIEEALSKDNKWNVRQAAIVALIGIGSASDRSVPLVINALRDENFDVRYTAGLFLDHKFKDAISKRIQEVVGQSEEPAVKAVFEDLISTLGEGRQDSRRDAAGALIIMSKACVSQQSDQFLPFVKEAYQAFNSASDEFIQNQTPVLQAAVEKMDK